MALRSFSADAPKTLSGVLIHEVSFAWSRDRVTVAASAKDVPVGTVLTLNGDTFTPLLTGQSAVAVLAVSLPASSADSEAAVLARGCVVSREGLIFDDGLSADDRKTACADLTALGIVVRD